MEHLAEEYAHGLARTMDAPPKPEYVVAIAPHPEHQYLNLLRDILANGHWEEGRNGRTKSIFGASMRFSLANGQLPLLTTKKMAWKTCLKELLWFVRGETDNTLLKAQGVHIWDANGSRAFLDSRGLQEYEEDELGPIYGWQWRRFNQPYLSKKQLYTLENATTYWNHELECMSEKREEEGVDQLQQIIDALKDPAQRTSRRLVLSAWNPCQLSAMALPPCHVMCQFNVHGGNQLSCAMYQRSVDTVLGLPFNIASYALLTHLLAKHCGLEACEVVYFMGNCHIYEEHVEDIQAQLSRVPLPLPQVSISEVREKIDDYRVDDFEVHGYQSHPPLKFKMVA